MMNELHLFSGKGGGILGGMLLGHTPVCAVEKHKHSIKVILQRQREENLPWFPVWDDVCTFDGRYWNGIVDMVSAGFPCQPFSTASRGRKTAKDLWPEVLRVVGEIKPKVVFIENVSKKAIDQAGDDLESMGYNTIATQVSASDVGADHIRRRYWLLAYTNDQGKLLRQYYGKMEVMQELQTRVWATEPDNRRMVDGMADRVERYYSTGNGQVPAVVRYAFIMLCRMIP